MRLKKVQIFGFKTFADKTVFDIDADLIAVVGPNGCGKSNIVDAILWGLGETKASQLRAKTGQDVIFAGSHRRRRLGYAEVTLLFDNEDGTLPIDTLEVSVTRRLTRGGDSHYRINGRTCRLRDVNDLLADSGMGRAGYAIVGQQEVDQALAVSAQQRREWIDEAAGVMRYRARRTESLRRLESADEHLDRVGDIIREIEVQRSPLEKEASAAREYKQIRSSLTEVESGLLVKEIANAVTKLDELDERLKSATKVAEDEAARAEKLEQEASDVTDKLAAVEERIDGLRQQHHDAQTAFEQSSAALQVAQSKLENLELLESTMSVEAVAGQERVSQAEEDLKKAVAEEQSEAKALDQLRAELSGADGEARKLTHELRSADTELNKNRKLAVQSQRIELEAEHRLSRIESIDEEVRGIAAAVPDLQKAIKEAEATFAELDAAMKGAREMIRDAEQELARLRKDEEQHAAATRELLGEIAVLEGRKKGIQATIDAHEGLTQGARAVLKAVEKGTLKGKYTPVGESIEVDPKYALAIDAVLGPATNDLIVSKESDAKRAIALLKEGKLGRATFQPIPLMKPPPSKGLDKLLHEPGVIGLASRLVECDEAYRPVIESLLGAVLVTQDLETSLRISKAGGRWRLVTLEGDVVYASGAVTGGRSVDHTAGIVQRKAETAAIEAKVSRLEKKLQALKSENAGHEQAANEQIERLEGARAEIDDRATEHDESREWTLNLRHELQATERAREKLKKERDALAKVKDESVADFDEKAAEDHRDALLKQLAAKSAGADQAGDRLKEAESRAMQASSRRIEVDRRNKSLAELEQTREERTQNIGPNREKYRGQIKQATKNRSDTEAGARKYRKTLEAATSEKRELIESNIALIEAAKEAQKTARSMSETAHATEIQRTRLDSRRSNAVQR
ncbi:MAG: chromosome segregation protein SMC, partial [Armatimonadetes bacterium]|nr:chromosome segregation protein SMC [Armatimonadota bacterium]